MAFWILLFGLVTAVVMARGVAEWCWRRRQAIAAVLRRAMHGLGLHRLGTAIARRWPRLGRWLQARFDRRHALGLPLTALVVLAVHLLGLGGQLVEELLEDRDLQQLDEQLHQGLDRMREARFVALFAWLTAFGDPQTLIACGLVTAAALLATQRSAMLFGLLLTVGGSQLATLLGKYIIDRPRPALSTAYEAITPSFPSGHTTGAVAVYGFIAYVLARIAQNPRLRFEVMFAAGLLMGLVALSRIVIGVHYVSDVAAGMVNGAFWVLAGVAVSEWLARERR